MMSLYFVDANVFLRFLTGDPATMADQARTLFEAVERGEIEPFVDEIVVAETVWVLQSFYGYPPMEISRVLQELLNHAGFVAKDKPGLLEALSLFAGRNIDFVDAVVAVHMRSQGVFEIFSFDHHFDRLPGIIRRSPAIPLN
jgi:uncharacterized protein